MKTALIYYSNTGNTEKIAEKVKNAFSPDVFKIELEKPYGGFVSSVGRYVKEHITKKEDKVVNEPVDFSDYDVIFLGSPVWAGSLPYFLSDYLKECIISGKTIIPFITAAGTGKESTLKTIEELFPDSEIKNYFFTSKREKNDPDEWIKTLKLPIEPPI